MNDASIGFAVIYRWRLVPGMETTFCEGWERVTILLKAKRGALGSRLHRADDGTWVAYAQWPSREAWEASGARGAIDSVAAAMMTESTAEYIGTTCLDPVCDRLSPVA